MPSKASTGSTERGGCDPAERCECGSLLARRTARGIEIKCRRCKRIMLIPFDDVVDHAEEIRGGTGPCLTRPAGRE